MSGEIWDELRAVFRRSTGMLLPEAVRGRAISLVENLAAEAGCPPLLYLQDLHDKRDARQVLLDELGLGTTWFMRDESGLRSLVNALARSGAAEARGKPLRLWSVGCSTGEEPYTLAMALDEAGVMARILATDLNRTALEAGRKGHYRDQDLRRLPAGWSRRHFRKDASGHMRISDDIRRMVSFELHNLQDGDRPPSGVLAFDAIVCRNVLIYFDRKPALEVIQRLAGMCRPGGYLLLGAIERPLFWMSRGPGLGSDPDDGAELVQIPHTRSERRARTQPGKTAVPKQVRPDKRPQTGPNSHQSLEYLMQRAEAAEREKRYDRALEFLDRAVERSHLDASARLQRGRILMTLGSAERAVPDLRAARCLDRNAWLAPYLLGRCLESVGEPDEALEAYRYAHGVLQSGGRSGYYREDPDVEGMASMTAESCLERIRKLSSE